MTQQSGQKRRGDARRDVKVRGNLALHLLKTRACYASTVQFGGNTVMGRCKKG